MIPLHDDNPTRRFPLVTLALIALNVAVFVFQLTLPRYGLTVEGFYLRAGLVPYEVVNRVDVPPDGLVPIWATVFTSMFIHGGWLHIIFNLLYLWIFGNNVED
ncbi:MAG: rhomboid family intramembrane serine protease, partial [Thermoleophilia bacterium]|nr:rhomboid family intramembrane serine protease [Thermoleophilia bacterium]